ncbi:MULTISPECIES: GNAT family N-acetyltransferase [Pseudomonas]|uniref:GNAT family N-acetyltransferase n=1 Tax=Pseudomonas mosselii TaxID=78327 RepID=A0A5R8Z5Z1_9PSED|nr:GNAT family N-acetyltransferase [Pseudomonas mosselii]TLP61163.1 GNAT family N-acetyltransferase [Pseudomonas mosselii]
MSKARYAAFSEQNNSLPLFLRSWWLDALAGSANWDVALVEKGDDVVACLPYVVTQQYGLRTLGQPRLTQHLGVWLREGEAKYANRLSQQKEWMEALINQLPAFDHFIQNWSYQQGNWLPFYWHGFKQTTRYTYALPDLSDITAVWDGFQAKIRTDIRKASERFSVTVRTDLGIEDFYALNQQVFTRQGIAVPYDLALLQRLDRACQARECRRIFIAEDAQGKRHAAVYLVWDENSAYYLMGGSDPALRNSGATSLCMWEAIRHAATVTQRFDFEGSMLEPVERFFRGFGAVQVPYFSLSKTPSRLIRAALLLRDLKAGS